MKKLFLFLLLLLPLALHAQEVNHSPTVTVSGRVISNSGETLPGANIYLVNRQDTLQQFGVSSGNDGSFTLSIPPALYRMRVSYVGYRSQTAELEATKDVRLPDISLEEESQVLDALTVTGRSVIYSAEGYRVNIGNNPHLKEMDLDRVLNFLPGLTQQDGELKVYGKPVFTVYLNRRKLRLSGQELISYLQNYEGKNIKDIQVITSTGAEESAAGGGGATLRITTTKIEDGGTLSARLAGDYNKQRRSLSLPGLNVQTRNGKWSTYGTANFYRFNLKNLNESNTLFLDSGTERETSYRSDRKSPSYSFTAGVGYDFSPNDIFTLEGRFYKGSSEDSSVSRVRTLLNGVETGNDNTLTEGEDKSISKHLSADYLHSWKSGELYLSAIYLYNNGFDNRVQERENNPDLWSNRAYNDNNRTLTEGKIDLRQQVGKGTLKAGIAYSNWDNEDYTDNRLIAEGAENALGTYTDLYHYKEEIKAAYASYDFNVKKWSVSAGLRYEHKRVEPQSSLTPERNHTYSKGNLFPNLRLNYALNPMKGHNLNLSYARTIQSPSINMLNPGIKWNNEYSYSMGNPYMEPVCSNTYSGILSLFNFYTLGYNYVESPLFIPITQKEADSDILYNTYENGGKRKLHNFSLGLMQMFSQWMVNATIGYVVATDEYQTRDIDNQAWNLSLNVSGQLPGGLTLNLNGFYVSPSKNINGSSGRLLNTSAVLSKSFLKQRLTASLSYGYIPPYTVHIDIEGVKQSYRSNASPHSIQISLRYRMNWGNDRARVRTNRVQSEEQKRLQ